MQRAITLPMVPRSDGTSSEAQKYGPPAVAPTPFTIEECATPNCTAMNAPEEIPETEVSLRSTLYDFSASAAEVGPVGPSNVHATQMIAESKRAWLRR